VNRKEVRRLNLSPWQRHALRALAAVQDTRPLASWEATPKACDPVESKRMFRGFAGQGMVRIVGFDPRSSRFLITDYGREVVAALDAARLEDAGEPAQDPELYLCIYCGRRTTACQCDRGGTIDGE
jgi:hypothetical protein